MLVIFAKLTHKNMHMYNLQSNWIFRKSSFDMNAHLETFTPLICCVIDDASQSHWSHNVGLCTLRNFKIIVTNLSQGSAATLSRWGGQINNVCVAYCLSILCAKYCRNRSKYVDTTMKWTWDNFYSFGILRKKFRLNIQVWFDVQ